MISDLSWEAVVEEALALSTVSVPDVAASPGELVEHLVSLRGRLDRVAEIQAAALIQRSVAELRWRRAQVLAAEAWDREASKAQVVKRQEFEGAKERYSRFNLAVLEERKRERELRDEYDIWCAAYESIRTFYFRLDGSRMDIHIRLRTLAWELSLER